ncbi:MAG: fused MFS/spermidine synthase [Synergistaceae bacterium]|jgi:spermidine synthase/MFS family permease|nr:fused MFS/spermidine synthase [Synergistaceae bacterium]
MIDGRFRKAEAPAKRRRGVLEVASFLCGAAVMVLEMAGSRIVAPYMGTSLIVWTSLIGVIMASLSAGYWLGGAAADRWPEMKILARVVLGAAFFTAMTAFAANPILTVLFRAFSRSAFYFSSAAGALLLFSVPSVLLGMVSPFIVKLAMRDLGTSGATVGRFSALSSLGSILGTFLGGFVLISLFPAGTILLLTAGILALVAALLYRAAWSAKWKNAAFFCAAFFALFGTTVALGMPMMPPGVHIDTAYNHIWVAEEVRPNGQRARYLMTASVGEGAQSVIYTKNPAELVSSYTKFYDLAFHYKPDAKKILMLGGGGYCVPRHLNATRPEVSVDVVEIDPGITDAARKFFYLQDRNNPNITVYHEDARIFLNRMADTRANARMADTRMEGGETGLYDAVFADVFGAWYSIPFHLATVEAAQKMYDLLAEDGVLVSNVISALKGPRSGVFDGIYAAVAQVFPKVLIFPARDPRDTANRQNLMIVAFKSEKTFDAAPPPENPETARLLLYRWTPPFTPAIPPFTDAFAPVEYYALTDPGT